jgi:hypothetical protein
MNECTRHTLVLSFVVLLLISSRANATVCQNQEMLSFGIPDGRIASAEQMRSTMSAYKVLASKFPDIDPYYDCKRGLTDLLNEQLRIFKAAQRNRASQSGDPSPRSYAEWINGNSSETAEADATKTTSPAQDSGPGIDLFGLKLGMTQDEVRTVIREKMTPGAELIEGGSSCVDTNFKCIEFFKTTIVKVNSGQPAIELQVDLIEDVTNNPRTTIVHSVRFEQGDSRIEPLKAATSKYGPPGRDNGIDLQEPGFLDSNGRCQRLGDSKLGMRAPCTYREYAEATEYYWDVTSSIGNGALILCERKLPNKRNSRKLSTLCRARDGHYRLWLTMDPEILEELKVRLSEALKQSATQDTPF